MTAPLSPSSTDADRARLLLAAALAFWGLAALLYLAMPEGLFV